MLQANWNEVTKTYLAIVEGRPRPAEGVIKSYLVAGKDMRVHAVRDEKGARRLIVLPTGYACSTHTPPVGAVANALHALTLLIARQLVAELEGLGSGIEYYVVPPLCPLVGSPYDFSRTADHIERAIRSTDDWLAQNGLQRGGIPDEMRPHTH